jgi:hypothetical protein
MSTPQRKVISIFTVILAVSVIALGLSAFQGGATPGTPLDQSATPSAPQGQLPTVAITPYPTPFNPGPEVEGTEVGEGISQEGGYFINDLANKLNIPVATLEAAISSSLIDADNQALNQGLIDQNAADALNQRATQMFSSGSGFFFDIDEFGPTSTPTPALPAPIVITSVVTSVVTERPTKTSAPPATPTTVPTHVVTLSFPTSPPVKKTLIIATLIFPRPTRTPLPVFTAIFHTPVPLKTPIRLPTFRSTFAP